MTKKPTPHAGELQTLTLEEHQKLKREYTAALQLVIERRASWFAAQKRGGFSPAAPLSDIEKAIRSRATALANGHALAPLPPPAGEGDESQLLIEEGALKFLLRKLDSPQIINAAMTQAALQWDEDNYAACRDLDRETLLTAKRLEVLERRRFAMSERASALVHHLPRRPLDKWWGRSMVGVNWEHNPLREPLEAAKAAGIVTAAEIERVEND